MNPEILQGHSAALAEYIRANRREVLERLAQTGSLLFRGFAPLTRVAFRDAISQIVDQFMESHGEHTRLPATPYVFNPVPYSSERKLLCHNENSFNRIWPHVIAFGCVRPADRGGESLLVDSRALISALDSTVVDEFEARGVQYIRRMGLGIDRHWKDIFGTDSRSEVEARCAADDCTFRWRSASVLETVCVRRATVIHPLTGARCWFNQAQHWHWQCLEPHVRQDLLGLLGKEMMPRECRFGDGTMIPDEMMAHVMDAFRSLEIEVPCGCGDVLLVDNLATAHGRNPFEGARELLVSMGTVRWENLR